VIALLRSIDVPIADVRRILTGAGEAERHQIFRDHRARLKHASTKLAASSMRSTP
jgi:hypothetical protein